MELKRVLSTNLFRRGCPRCASNISFKNRALASFHMPLRCESCGQRMSIQYAVWFINLFFASLIANIITERLVPGRIFLDFMAAFVIIFTILQAFLCSFCLSMKADSRDNDD